MVAVMQPTPVVGEEELQPALLSIAGVEKLVSLKKSQIYALIAINAFPKPCKIGVRVGGAHDRRKARWAKDELDAWVADLKQKRDAHSP